MASLDFLIPVDRTSAIPLSDQLYRLVREAILDGRLSGSTRLPSSRVVAQQTGVARQTVVEAFEQLVAEGYAVPRPASGTYVAETLPDELLHVGRRRRPSSTQPAGPRKMSRRGTRIAELESSDCHSNPLPRPFQTGRPALEAFPFDVWARLIAGHLRRRPAELLGYGEPAGYRPLREAIAGYVNAVRAARCTAAEVIITAGTQQAVQLAAQVLLDPGDRVLVEEPGDSEIRAALVAAGARLVGVPVDNEGLDINSSAAQGSTAKLAVVTPSHQYPLGMVMSLQRRRRLLEWARRAGAWILEDDYDSEYRYTGRPLAALQGLDTDGRVVYLGTFSKVLFPALRLGFIIAPADLLRPLIRARALADRHSPTLEQAALADFIADGHLARHIRRMRALYAERRDVLLELADRQLRGMLDMQPAQTGMHVVGWLPDGVDDRVISRDARAGGVEAAPLSPHYQSGRPPRGGLVLGFSAFDAAQLRAGVTRLATILRSGVSTAA